MKKITDVKDLKGRYVLLRSSLNLPLNEDGSIRNNFRLLRALPTMRYLHESGARVIVVSHIGRDPKDSLKVVFSALEKHLPIQWGGSVITEGFRQRRALMTDGDLLMAENLRQHQGEKNNDAEFVNLLSSMADIYVNDAFAVAHRNHASILGVPMKMDSYAGITFYEEVNELKKAMNPQSPSLFILGGAKFDTKIPLIKKYLDLYDKVFIGGALANDIFKLRGYEVGKSLVSGDLLLEEDIVNNKKLLLPIDVVAVGDKGKRTCAPDAVLATEKILDCGPATIEMLSIYIESAKTILWNGPVGAYEMGYVQGTEIIARHVASSEAFSVIGGGDTLAAVEKLNIYDLFGFVSIAGGAMLAFLEQGDLPSIKVLE